MSRRVKAVVALFARRGDVDCCGTCRHFESDPRRLEAMLPNLTVLGSAHASVVAGDGICRRHDTYQSRRFGCGDFMPARGPSSD